MTLSTIRLGELMLRRGGSVDPAKHKDEEFDLYSIPAFDKGASELVMGRDIGSSKQQLEQNDILLSKIVPHIRRAWVVGESRGRRQIGSGEWIVFRSKAVNPRYISHVLVGDPFHKEFMQTVSGVGGSLLRARPAQVAEIQIPLPPLAEQKRIAAILDAADALRAKRREALAQLDALLQSTFLTLFGDPVTNPMGWVVCQLGDVCRGKPTYGSGSSACEYDPSLPRYVRITDVDDAGNLSNDPKCAQLTKKEIEKYSLREGDILFARSGATVGKSYLHRAANGNCVYAGYMIRFCPDPQRLLPETLFRFTQTEAYWRWVNSQARVVAQPNINAQIYSSMPVIIPPLPLQQKFAAIVESIEHQKTTQRAHLAELDALFAALQHRAFRGEL